MTNQPSAVVLSDLPKVENPASCVADNLETTPASCPFGCKANNGNDDDRRGYNSSEDVVANGGAGGLFSKRIAPYWLIGGLLLPGILVLGLAPNSSQRRSDVISRPARNKNIEDLVVGDMVMAWDEKSGGLAPCKVTRVYCRIADHIRVLLIRSADGLSVQTFQTTDEHPFRVSAGWCKASELDVGQQVRQGDGGWGTVVSTSLEACPAGVPVYNIETEGLHTYLVAAGGAGGPAVLVHNCNKGSNQPLVPKKGPSGSAAQAKAQTPKKAGPPVRQDANGRWRDAQGRYTQAPRPPLAGVLEGHPAGQGFTGVFDSATGRIGLNPSSAEAVLPPGFVPRAGGHANVSQALGGNAANHSGFAVIIEQNGTLRVTWRSGTLNNTPGSLVPESLRPRIIQAIEEATGRTVSSH